MPLATSSMLCGHPSLASSWAAHPDVTSFIRGCPRAQSGLALPEMGGRGLCTFPPRAHSVLGEFEDAAKPGTKQFSKWQ